VTDDQRLVRAPRGYSILEERRLYRQCIRIADVETVQLASDRFNTITSERLRDSKAIATEI
jgi:hypothetical protein